MNIKAQIDRMNAESSKAKAYASVNLDDTFVVKGIRIIEGKDSLFAAMPSESYKNKNNETKYSDTFFALTAEDRQQLSDAVLSAYEQKLQQSQAEVPEEMPEETQSGLTMTM